MRTTSILTLFTLELNYYMVNENYNLHVLHFFRIMNEQTEKLRNHISEINASNAKLQAQAEFSVERYDVLKKAYEDTKKVLLLYCTYCIQ